MFFPGLGINVKSIKSVKVKVSILQSQIFGLLFVNDKRVVSLNIEIERYGEQKVIGYYYRSSDVPEIGWEICNNIFGNFKGC